MPKSFMTSKIKQQLYYQEINHQKFKFIYDQAKMDRKNNNKII